MVNQSDGVVPTSDSIQLPASISENEPKENIVIMISKEDIVVQGRFIASTSKLLQSQEDIIPELKPSWIIWLRARPSMPLRLKKAVQLPLWAIKKSVIAYLKGDEHLC